MKIGFRVEGERDEQVVPILVERLLGFPIQPVLIVRPSRGFGAVVGDLSTVLKEFQSQEVAAAVVVVDNDHRPSRERKGRLEQEVRKAEKAGVAIRVFVIVAVQALEAWLLADEQAIAQAVGASHLSLQPDPETIDDAKTHFKELVGPYLSQNPDLRESHLRQIAENLNLQTVKKRCRSFQRFARDLDNWKRTLISHPSSPPP